MRRRTSNLWTTLSMLTAVLGGSLLLAGDPAAAGPGRERWRANYFPNVPLVTTEGETVHFYDDLIKDKVVAINFIFTSCGDSCPAETARLRQVQELLGDRVGRDIFMYSISIDPKHDTPEVLAEYTKKFDIGPGWMFLTGREEDITTLRKKLGLFIDEIQDGSGDHNVSLIVGNEATGRWMRRSPFDNPKALATTIGDWLHNWKVKKARTNDYEKVKTRPQASRGEYLFRSRCSSCHSLGGGDGMGPDLIGVTHKRDPAWLARWIAVPDEMLAEEDPLAVALFNQYRQLPMPNLGLNDVDVAAVIDFIEKQSPRQSGSAR
ncbi:MAG: SCO family protein [Myxococcota bacterium]|nr:SCO family protein [Myxococcota bacterium]